MDLELMIELNKYFAELSLISGLNDMLIDCMMLGAYESDLAMGMNVICMSLWLSMLIWMGA